jgi:hypothetical protein
MNKVKRIVVAAVLGALVLGLSPSPAWAAGDRVERTTTFSCDSGQQVRIRIPWTSKIGSPKIEVGWINNAWVPRSKTSPTLSTSSGTYTVFTGTQRLRSIGVGWTAYGAVVNWANGSADLSGPNVACVPA